MTRSSVQHVEDSSHYGLPVRLDSTLTEKDIRIRVISAVAGPIFILKHVTANIVKDKTSTAGWLANVLVDLRDIEIERVEKESLFTELEREHIVGQVQKQLFGDKKNIYAKLNLTNIIPLKAANGEGAYLRGVLEINGKRQEISFPMLKCGEHYEGRFTFKQSDFGFQPLKSFTGALCASNDVTVEVTLTNSGSFPS